MCAPKADFDDVSEVGTVSTVGPDSMLDDSLDSLNSSVHTSSSRNSHVSTPRSHGRARYWSRKPTSWFQDVIDVEGTGKVDFRRFLAALRKHPGLQVALAEAAGIAFSAGEQSAHKRLSVTGPLAPSVQQRSDLLLQERSRVKQIFQQMCDSPDGTLDLTSFLRLFYKQGLILDCS
jgi:hypothetical protein